MRPTPLALSQNFGFTTDNGTTHTLSAQWEAEKVEEEESEEKEELKSKA